MFERYTEKARRVIFFARYEASHFGASAIEAEHVLLGLLREDKGLTNRFFPKGWGSVESVRKAIEGRVTMNPHVPTSVDLPLSLAAKRVLAYAQEESERLQHRHIGTEHLLLGLLREEKALAAEILHELGVRLGEVRTALSSHERLAAPSDRLEASVAELPYDREVDLAFAFAQQAAGRLGAQRVDALHLLLGILYDEGSRASKLLAAHGVTVDAVRGEIDEDGS